jgi:DNA-binding transcriptional regulator YiaG
MASTGDFAWIQAWHDEQVAKLKAELRFQLLVMPSGKRIRTLRTVFGWTQRVAAEQLQISVRTLIRHEQGRNRTPWLRLPLLLRLRELESVYEEQIIAYHTRRPVRT